MSIFDISPSVIEHVQRARERAAKDMGYVIQLPRDASASGPPELIGYWNSLGDQVGTGVDAHHPSADLPRAWRRERYESVRTWFWPVSRWISILFSNA